jgi:hypothetical protein
MQLRPGTFFVRLLTTLAAGALEHLKSKVLELVKHCGHALSASMVNLHHWPGRYHFPLDYAGCDFEQPQARRV